MSIKKEDVIAIASKIADEKGMYGVSLKVVAERLQIKTPSLYNHIESLDELLREIAHKGMREQNDRMMRSAVGKSGEDAIQAVGLIYLQYVVEHPGVYEVTQWATWNGSEETLTIFEQYKDLLRTLIATCNIEKEKQKDALELIMSVLHGYITFQLRYAFKDLPKVQAGLERAIHTSLIGLLTKEK